MALPSLSTQTVNANSAGSLSADGNISSSYNSDGQFSGVFSNKGRFKFSIPAGAYVKKLQIPYTHNFASNYYLASNPTFGMYNQATIRTYYRWGASFDSAAAVFSNDNMTDILLYSKGTSATQEYLEWTGVNNQIYNFNGYPTATTDSERGVQTTQTYYGAYGGRNGYSAIYFTHSNAQPLQMIASYYIPILPELGSVTVSNITKTSATLNSNLLEDGYYDNDGLLARLGCTIKGFCYKLADMPGEPLLSDNVHTASFSTSLSDPNKLLEPANTMDSYSQAAAAQWEIGRTYIASTTGTFSYSAALARVSNVVNATFSFRIRKNGVDQWTYSTTNTSSNLYATTLLTVAPGDVITFETLCSHDLNQSMGFTGVRMAIDQNISTIYQVFQQSTYNTVYTEGTFSGTLNGVQGARYKIRPYAINGKGVSYGATIEVQLTGWLDPTYAYTDDANFTTLPYTSNGQVNVELSINGGSTWTSAKSLTLTGSETTQTVGSVTGGGDTWGLSITGDKMGNTDFRIRISPTSDGSADSKQIYGGFGFSINPAYYITGVEVAVKGYWDGSKFFINHVKVRSKFGTVSTPVIQGSNAYASDARKASEGAGLGTGNMVFWDGNNWIRYDTGTSAQA